MQVNIDPSIFQSPYFDTFWANADAATRAAIQSQYPNMAPSGGGMPVAPIGGNTAVTAPTVTPPAAVSPDPYADLDPYEADAAQHAVGGVAGYVPPSTYQRTMRQRALNMNMSTIVQAAQAQGMSPRQLASELRAAMRYSVRLHKWVLRF